METEARTVSAHDLSNLQLFYFVSSLCQLCLSFSWETCLVSGADIVSIRCDCILELAQPLLAICCGFPVSGYLVPGKGWKSSTFSPSYLHVGGQFSPGPVVTSMWNPSWSLGLALRESTSCSQLCFCFLLSCCSILAISTSPPPSYLLFKSILINKY